ncbi:unnamed protein product [Rotaria sp. Silwood2]|nr:unnamed protein product [Rotaria sp. Silwood2]CAF4377003.1 unnamed protein product [Rotaria sp. Silwood2]
MTHINPRLLDVGEEHLNALAPLRGYAEEPLLSLKDAIVKLRKLLDDVDARVWTATSRCKSPADKLTQDESAAIVLYTMEWDPSHPSLYSVLNRTLRLEDRRKLIPWFPYLKLVFTALFKLPSTRCTVWRGVRGDLRSHYQQGDNVTWWAFSSCTTTINVLETDQYLGTSGPRTLFAIDCLNGKDIKRHSYFVQEEEILLLPCTHFQVISHLSSMENLYIIHLREIPPPFMFLEPPNRESAALKMINIVTDEHRFKDKTNIRLADLSIEIIIIIRHSNDRSLSYSSLLDRNAPLVESVPSEQQIDIHLNQIASAAPIITSD